MSDKQKKETGDMPYAPTPLMRQYYSIKAENPEAILLFRAGDFYETFGEDAVTTSRILGITLTKRANGSASSVPLAGFPHHAIETYLPKLIQAGERVAICEQLEDPKASKGIVKRGVTELVTPGVSFNDNVLSQRENNFLGALLYGKGDLAGVAILDASTGEFFVAQGKTSYIDKLLSNLSPKELLISPSQSDVYDKQFSDRYYTYKLEDWAWNLESNRDKLKKQFDVRSLRGFGIDRMPLAITAAGAIIHYLEYTRHNDLSHIKSISHLNESEYLWVDRFTARNLELFNPLNEGGRSLIDILDRTVSPMGGRVLRRWLSLPLRELEAIAQRHNAVDLLCGDSSLRDSILDRMSDISDPERIAAKIAALRVNPKEIVLLSASLKAAQKIRYLIEGRAELSHLYSALDVEDCVVEYIDRMLLDEPALAVGKGNIIAQGVNEELDELRALSKNSKEYLVDMASRESERTGIPSLKIAFNNVFGYYIEVRNAHKDKVPEQWIRKQTLVNAERYITEELKLYEEKILSCQTSIEKIESQLLSDVITYLQPFVHSIIACSGAVGQLDTLMSFALVAKEYSYVRPEMDDSQVVDISDCRHPVIERCLPLGDRYIPNDLYLDSETQQIIIITGPNMAGKSALLRQTALVAIMAQIGSFVPASRARLGVIDRLFTRVGASDNISQGESTFMVEMLESANILNNLTSRSLILLDEIGRGTSTYDGLSIAWSMVEYIHRVAGARTLFATHYHELNELEHRFARIKNYNVAVREVDRRVIFLRKLVRGGTEHSFGIHVASMAGMPQGVIRRAQAILSDLEAQRATGLAGGASQVNAQAVSVAHQLSIFQLDDPTLSQVRSQLEQLDVDELTPRQALDQLYELKRLIGVK
ncbi:MAG: DNA mismatch repair protein MutS [Rikenellaceae bacterium]